jgi:hypothetical protein
MIDPNLPLDHQGINDPANDDCNHCTAITNEDGELEHTATCATLKDPDDYPEPD